MTLSVTCPVETFFDPSELVSVETPTRHVSKTKKKFSIHYESIVVKIMIVPTAKAISLAVKTKKALSATCT